MPESETFYLPAERMLVCVIPNLTFEGGALDLCLREIEEIKSFAAFAKTEVSAIRKSRTQTTCIFMGRYLVLFVEKEECPPSVPVKYKFVNQNVMMKDFCL